MISKLTIAMAVLVTALVILFVAPIASASITSEVSYIGSDGISGNVATTGFSNTSRDFYTENVYASGEAGYASAFNSNGAFTASSGVMGNSIRYNQAIGSQKLTVTEEDCAPEIVAPTQNKLASVGALCTPLTTQKYTMVVSGTTFNGNGAVSTQSTNAPNAFANFITMTGNGFGSIFNSVNSMTGTGKTNPTLTDSFTHSAIYNAFGNIDMKNKFIYTG